MTSVMGCGLGRYPRRGGCMKRMGVKRAMNCSAASAEVSVETGCRGERDGSRLRGRRERGSSLIEFAVVMPMLMLLVTGIYTFGIFLNNDISLTDAVNTAARQAAISRNLNPAPDLCAQFYTTINNAAPL